MLEINEEKIKGVADFSKLEFSDDRLKVFEKEFSNILEFVTQIKGAKIDKTAPKYDTILELDDLRPDEVRTGLTIGEVLQNAPRKQGRYFVVPKVVE
ncbi:MAG: Asp-tRNA(Asn)/Glu-tRNA(Gln) amidotransferase subunit GatC [Christensenellaceae bacterium]|jgi:aspartyl-tRNA(Asn)/glutamyl-tRNA(Gln) amidotransferase subunit C|nr:Asp-tRNA(Asn)/Glu-tRNA(Gln) amidotransferase subunit GatC [Christensenellaceae bacterium]